ncbi:MAG TPA: zinc-binding dehydrogenase, partial [Chloroflexota bacterium]|nr:zinc-binding dehydrogenase [Chloroflexota bacterium]
MSPVVVALEAPGRVSLIDEDRRALGSGEVRIRTLFSGVSAGTEMAFYRGTNPYLSKHWDPATRLFIARDSQSVTYPVTTWGYEEVGSVVEVGADVGDVAVGQRVFGTWGHRAEHVAPAEWVRTRRLPAGADPLLGTFSHIGPIALNGVLDAHVRLGETVAVFGLGVVGQLVAQLLARSGAHVIGVDLLASRRDVAARLTSARVLDAATVDAAEEIKRLTDGRGADVCIEASGTTRAFHAAIRACAYASRVVALGFYQGEASGLFLGEEFHHNRIQLVCSQIGGISPELQHRWDRARLVRTFMDLAMAGDVRPTKLITHRVPVREAAELYASI